MDTVDRTTIRNLAAAVVERALLDVADPLAAVPAGVDGMARYSLATELGEEAETFLTGPRGGLYLDVLDLDALDWHAIIGRVRARGYSGRRTLLREYANVG